MKAIWMSCWIVSASLFANAEKIECTATAVDWARSFYEGRGKSITAAEQRALRLCKFNSDHGDSCQIDTVNFMYGCFIVDP